MARQNEARTEIRPWLEHLAWNAAALAALSAMLLVLLGSLEWLDHVTPAPMPEPPRSLRATGKPARPLPVLAGGGAGQRVIRGEGCVAPPSGSG